MEKNFNRTTFKEIIQFKSNIFHSYINPKNLENTMTTYIFPL